MKWCVYQQKKAVEVIKFTVDGKSVLNTVMSESMLESLLTAIEDRSVNNYKTTITIKYANDTQ